MNLRRLGDCLCRTAPKNSSVILLDLKAIAATSEPREQLCSFLLGKPKCL